MLKICHLTPLTRRIISADLMLSRGGLTPARRERLVEYSSRARRHDLPGLNGRFPPPAEESAWE